MSKTLRFFNRYSIIGIIALWMSSFAAAHAQSIWEPILGGGIGVDYLITSANFQNSGAEPYYNHFSSGDGTQWQLGVDLEWPDLFNEGFGANLRLDYVSHTGQFTHDPPSTMVMLPGGNLSEQIIQHRFEFHHNAARFDLGARLDMGNGIALKGGITTSFFLDRRYKVTQSLISPSTGQFQNPEGYPTEDGGRTIIYEDDPGPNFLDPGSTGGLFISATYDLPSQEGYTLTPEIMGRWDITSPTEGEWERYTIGLGLRVKFDPVWRGVADHSPLANDRMLEKEGVPPLTANIDLYARGNADVRLDTASIAMRGELRRNHTSLLPVIVFDNDAATIPERYTRIGSSAVERFTLDSVARLEPGTIYRNALNIVGRRLRDNPSSEITLTAVPGKGDAATLSQERAESVRAYLRDVWEIDESRMKIHVERKMPRRGLVTGNVAYIEIGSSSAPVMEPLVAEWIEQTPSMPSIGLDPAIEGGSGERRWTLTISRDGRELVRSSSDDADRGASLSLDLPFAESRASFATAPLIAELSVADESGARVTARDELPIVVPDTTVAAGIGAREEYLLAAIGGELLPEGKNWLRSIMANGSAIERVTITPAVEDDARSVKLIEAITKQLRTKGITVTRGAARSESGDLSYPEARHLPASARLVVELTDGVRARAGGR